MAKIGHSFGSLVDAHNLLDVSAVKLAGSQTVTGAKNFTGGLTVLGNSAYHDNYHPEADTWTAGRTLSLSGDASGSVAIDGSSDVSLTVAIANDSHTHDGRYFTEAESDLRYMPRRDAEIGLISTYSRNYVVRVDNPIPITDMDGGLLPSTGAGTLRVRGYTGSTGSLGVSALATFHNSSTGWVLISSYNNREISNHPRFHVVNGVPVVSTWHPNDYPVHVHHEYVPEGSHAGSHAGSFWGADALFTATENEIVVGGYLVGDIVGNASTATRLQNSRTIALSGDASGSVTFDGSGNVSLPVTVSQAENATNAINATNATNANTATSAVTATNCSRSVMAGDGLSGGGALSANRTLAVDSTVIRTSGGQRILGSLDTQGLNVNTGNGTTPFRIQRQSNDSVGQDDNVTMYTTDSAMFFVHNNDDDSDASTFIFQYMTNGVASDLLLFSASGIKYKDELIFREGYHPNADKWTTPRTLTLAGAVEGSVLVDGSTNRTINTHAAVPDRILDVSLNTNQTDSSDLASSTNVLIIQGLHYADHEHNEQVVESSITLYRGQEECYVDGYRVTVDWDDGAVYVSRVTTDGVDRLVIWE